MNDQEAIAGLKAIVEKLRSENGCSWDRVRIVSYAVLPETFRLVSCSK